MSAPILFAASICCSLGSINKETLISFCFIGAMKDLKLEIFLQTSKPPSVVRSSLFSGTRQTAFGNTSNFTTLSDIKYKKDITRISESLDRVLELKPSKFVWKTTDTEDIGFIAQEVEEIIPEVVLTDKEGILGAPDTKDYKTITYPKLIPLLVDSIQELTKKVSTLEDKIKKLEK